METLKHHDWFVLPLNQNMTIMPLCVIPHTAGKWLRRSGIKFTDIAFNQKIRVIWMLAGPHVMSSGILTVELGKKETNKE